MNKKDKEMNLELNKVIAYGHMQYLNAKTIEQIRYWKGYIDAIDDLLDIARKYV